MGGRQRVLLAAEPAHEATAAHQTAVFETTQRPLEVAPREAQRVVHDQVAEHHAPAVQQELGHRFGELVAIGAGEVGEGDGLGGGHQRPTTGRGGGHFAVLTQGFPQLVRVSPDVVAFDDSQSFSERVPVIGQVRMVNEYPLIPDFERLEEMIEDETRA